MSKILVAYATKTGTTKEISEAIGNTLQKHGLTVNVSEIDKVDSLDEYTGIVIGAPINGMKWIPEALKFVEDNMEKLKSTPCACFAVSYLIVDGREVWKNAIKSSMDQIKAKINPFSTYIFGGKVGSPFPAPFRVMFGIKKGAPLDVTNEHNVNKWAEDLVTEFKKI